MFPNVAKGGLVVGGAGGSGFVLEKGKAVFTLTKAGAMAEASIGGQRSSTSGAGTMMAGMGITHPDRSKPAHVRERFVNGPRSPRRPVPQESPHRRLARVLHSSWMKGRAP